MLVLNAVCVCLLLLHDCASLCTTPIRLLLVFLRKGKICEISIPLSCFQWHRVAASVTAALLLLLFLGVVADFAIAVAVTVVVALGRCAAAIGPVAVHPCRE